jgi:hypothetical protein
MSPEIPALREAVQENDQRAFAFDHGTQPNAVGFDQLKIALFHIVFHLSFFLSTPAPAASCPSSSNRLLSVISLTRSASNSADS